MWRIAMERPLRWGIIGAGTWGKTHADLIKNHHLTELVAIADLDKGRADALANSYGASSYDDYREMLAKEKLDAVSVVTPDFAHAEPFIACCEAKVDVLLEKPLATTHEDLHAMYAAYKKSRRLHWHMRISGQVRSEILCRCTTG
jgi:predicted dehydrogenase